MCRGFVCLGEKDAHGRMVTEQKCAGGVPFVYICLERVLDKRIYFGTKRNGFTMLVGVRGSRMVGLDPFLHALFLQ
jgi:hypothetical protein